MAEERRKRLFRAGTLGPIILIIIGVVFLLEKNGIITRHMLSEWWPLLLIIIGVWLLLDRINRN